MPIENSSSRMRRRIRNITVPTGIVLVLASLNVNGANVHETTLQHRQKQGVVELLWGPCAPRPLFSSENTTTCDRAKSQGEVALVNFGVSTQQIDTLRSQVEEEIKEETLETSRPVISVIEATKKAKETFSRNSTCVNLNDKTRFASYAAIQTMPEIADYDLVFGVSADKKPCDDSLGVADIKQKRIADIYLKGMPLEEASLTGSHELLHLFGLGHAGTFLGRDGKQLSLSRYALANNTFDLTNDLQNYIYRTANDSTNIMGSYSSVLPISHTLNPMQIDELKTTKEQKNGMPVTEKQQTILQYADASADRYGYIDLHTPVKLDNEKLVFTRLAIVPLPTQNNNKHLIEDVVVYLTGINGGLMYSAKVGHLSVNNPLTIQQGNQQILVKNMDSSIAIRVKD